MAANTDVADQPDARTPPSGARLANALRWLVVAALACGAGWSWWHGLPKDAEHAGHTHAERYTCPMHPTYTANRPGSCPICGMDLVAASTLEAAPTSDDPGAFVLADLPGVQPVVISASRLQRAGVEIAKVHVGVVEAEESIPAVVRRDPSAQVRIEARAAGWLIAGPSLLVGQPVKKGEVLARLYSREVQAAQAELASARAAEALTGTNDLEAQVARRLRGMGAGTSRQTSGQVTIRAPQDGIVVEWSARSGSWVGPGQPLGTLSNTNADLIEAEVPVAWLGDGAVAWQVRWNEQVASTTLLGPTGESASGRGVIVRFRPLAPIGWPDGARVTLHRGQARRDLLAVPRSALVEADGRTWVYRRAPSGRLWPTPVQIALLGRHDAAVEPGSPSGLRDGDEVVVRGVFLVDAEARLAGPTPTPVAAAVPPADQASSTVASIATATAAPLSAAALSALLDATEAMADDNRAKTTAALQALDSALGTPLPFTPELDAARAGWKSFMQSLWPRLRATQEASQLHVAWCPMAPGRWLQRKATIQNPYFGAKMLRCGERIGLLSEVGAEPTPAEAP